MLEPLAALLGLAGVVRTMRLREDDLQDLVSAMWGALAGTSPTWGCQGSDGDPMWSALL